MMESEVASEVVLRGTISRVTFRNPHNGYVVFQLTVPDEEHSITIVGTCREAQSGSHVLVRGRFTNHPKFGRQLHASSVLETPPSSREGIERYLASGIIAGVGQKTAQRIVEAFGVDALEVALKEPDKIAALPGVGKKRGALLHEALRERFGNRDVMQFLIEHQVPPNLAKRIVATYSTGAVEVLKHDPYKLARDLRGVGFLRADEIARKLGLPAHSLARLKAGVFHALERAADEGHSYLTAEQLAQRSRDLLDLDPEHALDDAVSDLEREGYIVIVDGKAYLRSLERAERQVAQFFAARSHASLDRTPLVAPELVQDALDEAERSLNVTLSAEQRDGARRAAQERVLLVTGGPGCGKTTLIRAFTELFKGAGLRLFLAAPTGRAAQRISQVTGYAASTIHRLLKVDPMSGRFVYHAQQPLPADVVIIDEASMIDLQLMSDLVAAVPPEATLILVGDKDQLPSVGPGRVFGELLSLASLPIVSLTRLYRREDTSSITTMAHAINAGLIPPFTEPDGVAKSDAYFLARSDPLEVQALVRSLVCEQIPKKFGISQGDITVLTPSNRGPLGTQTLNALLQETLNPVSRHGEEQQITSGSQTFRLGDRVCQRVNNYSIDPLGVFNGDGGIVFEVNAQERSLKVELWDGRLVTYTERDLIELMLGYSMTVHRSQGSELPCVVLVLHDSHYTLLERQLVYTAMTRAKKLLIVVGSRRALALAARRATSARRQTMLAERIRESIRGHGYALTSV